MHIHCNGHDYYLQFAIIAAWRIRIGVMVEKSQGEGKSQYTIMMYPEKMEDEKYEYREFQ